MTESAHRPVSRMWLVLLVAGALALPLESAADEHDESMGMFIPSNSAAKNFYGGIRLGFGRNDYPDSNQDGSVTGVTDDENDTVYGVFGGYQLNDDVSVQAGYHDLGESDFAGTSSGGPSWEAGPVSALNEIDGWELGIQGRWPVADRWYAIGYVGWFWWESKETFVETSAITVETDSGSDVVYALGVEFDAGMRDRVVYRFMGAHQTADDFGYDVNSVSAEIVYRFP